MMKKKAENKLGTYNCSDSGDINCIFPTVYGSDYCI